MPRPARKKSMTNVYHVIIRGVNRTEIFCSDSDCHRFLSTLKRMKSPNKFHILAYCLMKNHVHLLVKTGEEPLEKSIQRINISYVDYFNKKYSRVGHLYQNRYRSEAVENEDYFLTCARYIHNNPVKAGITAKADDYRWSSFGEYVSPSAGNLVETETLLSLFSQQTQEAVQMLRDFTYASSADVVMDEDLTDCELEKASVRQKVLDILIANNESLESFLQLNANARYALIREILSKTEISGRELAKILGVGKNMVHRAINQAKRNSGEDE